MFLEQNDKINLLINIIILIVNADKLKLILIWKKYQEGKNIRLAKKNLLWCKILLFIASNR